jgi:hypothetical protein
MPDTIQSINATQNGQSVNATREHRTAEKPEPAPNERPSRAETSAPPKRAETKEARENQPRENTAPEKQNPQQVRTNKGNKEVGDNLDIMA